MYIETSNIKTTLSLKYRCSNTALPQRQTGYKFRSLTKDSYVPFNYPSEDSSCGVHRQVALLHNRYLRIRKLTQNTTQRTSLTTSALALKIVPTINLLMIFCVQITDVHYSVLRHLSKSTVYNPNSIHTFHYSLCS